ncbi:MAG: hypothetical protein J6A73_04730 [Lachnospiraceae bacterium]|nr:hypothetical protein [Lachnospiraceae bacterium]
MENMVEFIMQDASGWTPEVFIRLILVFAVLEGIFSLGAIIAYVGRGR